MNAIKKPPQRDMTIPEFLSWADEQPGRWQLRDGAPEMMAPAGDRHGSIQSELIADLSLHLRGTGSRCRVVTAPGVIPAVRSTKNMLVPDLGVTCAPTGEGVGVPDPIVLIEILSRANAARTRANVVAYKTIPTVAEIVVITSWRIEAEILRRLPDGSWPERPEKIGRDEPLRIARIGFEEPLHEIYRTTDLVHAP
jgi:Uma2 family endonuclease